MSSSKLETIVENTVIKSLKELEKREAEFGRDLETDKLKIKTLELAQKIVEFKHYKNRVSDAATLMMGPTFPTFTKDN